MPAPDPIAEPRPSWRLPEPRVLAWSALLAITAAAAFALYADLARGLRLNGAHLASDFIVFWTAAGSAAPYDFEALTAAQNWYMHTDTLRPFAYPPSFLPWLAPFRAVPMLPAFLVWVLLTGALFTIVWSRILGWRVALAALFAPVVVFAIVPGQMVFLQGALLVGGLALLPRHPRLAGLLLGLAATIKPQMMLLVPFALAAAGQWRALLHAAAGGVAVGVACLAVQGSGPWLAWIESLPRFMQVVRETGMLSHGITPGAMLADRGIEGAAAALASALAAALGLVLACLAFRASDDLRLRLLVLSSGTLLALPYAMPYELAVAAPAALSLLLDRRMPPPVWLAAFLFLTAAGQALAIVAMTLAAAWLAVRQARPAAPGEPAFVPA